MDRQSDTQKYNSINIKQHNMRQSDRAGFGNVMRKCNSKIYIGKWRTKP